MADEEWMNPDISEAQDTDDEFEGELFLSSDGKHTVHVKAHTKDSRKASLKWAKIVYERIIAAYGTKQAQAVKEYGKDQEKEKQAECPHRNTAISTSNSEKNKGRRYSYCVDCRKFLGWA